MSDRATDLLTEDGQRLSLGKRTGAIIMEVYALRERIDGSKKGRLEIIVDFANGSLTVATKEVGESRRIE